MRIHLKPLILVLWALLLFMFVKLLFVIEACLVHGSLCYLQEGLVLLKTVKLG